MNLDWLNMGLPGVFEAGALSFLVGLILHALIRWLGRGEGWTHAHEIAWSFLATVVLSAGADIWHLVYLGVVPMESPVTIQRVLANIHDPDYLGMRVVLEVIGAMAGVMVGWVAWTMIPRRGKTSSAP